jgi:hypothetical protein
MTDEQWQRLRPLLLRCCTSLFESHGLVVEDAVRDQVSPAGGEQVVGFISFEGEQMMGKLMLSAPWALLRRAHPLARDGVPLPEQELRDWICELLNQLLGRLKNLLTAHGVSFKVGIPRYFMGADLHHFYQPRRGARVLSLRWQELEAQLQVQAVVSRRVEFPALSELREGHLPEGEVLLF